jgi:hypothetical protein
VRHFRRFAEQGLNFLLGQLGFDVQVFVASGTGYLEELAFPDSRTEILLTCDLTEGPHDQP